MHSEDKHAGRPNLRKIARQAMIARGFLVDTPPQAREEIASKADPSFETVEVRDLTSFLWSSIDNDESKDLDQLEYVERLPDATRIYIGIADVDWFVRRDSMIDRAAQHNTTSVYTGVLTFPMLPEKLSTDLSSLNEDVKRLAIVVEMLVSGEGSVDDSSIYPAVVQSKAQLTYNAVSSWLQANTDNELEKRTASDADNRTLAKIRQSAELQEQLQLQNEVAKSLRRARHEAGALTFKRSEMTLVFSAEGEVLELSARQQNVASMLIEDFMIASNQATARFLEKHGFPSLRRVVRTPERWGKIVSIAASLGHELPDEPDAKSLEGFLRIRRQTDPAGFADLSLVIIKLLGRGEYLAASPGSDTSGHFALAATSYTHSTAPNRRFPDLVTQRLLKAAFAATPPPYSIEELDQLAAHCTERENAANKVERFVKKCAAAALLLPRIGELFDGIVTGVTSRGTWVRISRPEVEGKVFGATSELDVGDHIQVRLISADPEQGFIDFDLA